MSSIRQAREFFRFELRQQLTHPAFLLSALACVAAGVAFSLTELGAPEVAVGRIDRNAAYAVASNLAGLSAIGIFVVLVAVGQAALRDHQHGTAELIFSRPVRPLAWLAGRFGAGYCATCLALCLGAAAMLVSQLALQGRDPEIGPLPWSAFAYGLGLLALPNLLLVGSLVFLLALWTRSLGATFLGVLPIIIGQDIAEALPVSTWGYHLPALLDPLGLAALKSATHDWSVQQFASSLPALEGDLLWNRALWLGVALLAGLSARSVFRLRERREDRGRARGRALEAAAPTPAAPLARTAHAPIRARRGDAWRQAGALLRFEFARMASSLSFVLSLLGGLALVVYIMLQGEQVLGVRTTPDGRMIAAAVGRAAYLTMTLVVVLFSGELVWRERSTRMASTLDSFPVERHVLVAGKLAALALLTLAGISAFALLAWAMQRAQSGVAAPAGQLLALVAHESLGYLQIAAVALLLQTLAGSRATGYLAVGTFLALRIALRATGLRGELYSIASLRLPYLSEMDGFGHVWPRLLLLQAYWSLLALTFVLLASALWPRGIELSLRERLATARRRSRGPARALFALSLAASTGAGLIVWRTTMAPGMGWSAARLQSSLADYERDFQQWRERPRPTLTKLAADIEWHARERRLRVRARYLLTNPHALALDETLLSIDPDMRLVGLGLTPLAAQEEVALDALLARLDAVGQDFVSGVAGLATSSAGTRILHFDPPLAPGASIQLDFELVFDPRGLGPRPADSWLRENGAIFLCGTGSHPFFRGAQVFPILGYDGARELRQTRERRRAGLAAWKGPPTPAAWEAGPAESAAEVQGVRPGHAADWARVELWIHTDKDQTALAPGELLERWETAEAAHQHYRTTDAIQAFFPIVCGRYQKRVARAGELELEVYHDPAHAARVDHILWALQRSLAYFEGHWGSCGQQVLRLGEIPGQLAFACSFPGGMMAFGETMAFTLPRGAGEPLVFPAPDSSLASPGDLDPLLWIVAHEVAHQWWDGRVVAAEALGASFVSESLAQYGSLCVVREEYGEAVALRMAAFHREQYLQGRARADRAEPPLCRVDEQEHLHYGKGFVAFHALAETAGYEPIDRALRGLVASHAGALGRPLTSLEVLRALSHELSQSALEPLHELFEEVRFREAALTEARRTRDADGCWVVRVEGTATSVRVEPDGRELSSEDEGALELELLFGPGVPALRREVRIERGHFRFEEPLSEPTRGRFEVAPTAVRLDPRLLHIDRDLSDNYRKLLETRR